MVNRVHSALLASLHDPNVEYNRKSVMIFDTLTRCLLGASAGQARGLLSHPASLVHQASASTFERAIVYLQIQGSSIVKPMLQTLS